MRCQVLSLLWLVLCLGATRVAGQGLVWERRLGWVFEDVLTDVIPADDYFIAAGLRESYGQAFGVNGTWCSSATLTKFDLSGDTLWTMNTGFYSQYKPHLSIGANQSFYMVLTLPPDPGQDQLIVIHFNYSGRILNQWTLPNSSDGPVCQRVHLTWDGSLLLIGNRPASIGSGGITDMFVSRLEPTLGLVWFDKRFHDDPHTTGSSIEETSTHTYVASGSAGSRIWAIEIDSLGTELRRQTFYDTPTRAVMGTMSMVQQAPNAKWVVSGTPVSFTPTFYYLGCFSGFSLPMRLWGGERRLSESFAPKIQSDGSLLFFYDKNGYGNLARLGSDSSLTWDVRFQSQISTQTYPVLLSYTYVGDSTVIGVGRMKRLGSGNYGNEFYICRINNVGLPYNPTQPTATKAHIKGLPMLIAYPSPATTTLTIHTREQDQLHLMNLSGQVVLTAHPELGGTTRLDVASLPPGLYLLRQVQATVKVVKE